MAYNAKAKKAKIPILKPMMMKLIFLYLSRLISLKHNITDKKAKTGNIGNRNMKISTGCRDKEKSHPFIAPK